MHPQFRRVACTISADDLLVCGDFTCFIAELGLGDALSGEYLRDLCLKLRRVTCTIALDDIGVGCASFVEIAELVCVTPVFNNAMATCTQSSSESLTPYLHTTSL